MDNSPSDSYFVIKFRNISAIAPSAIKEIMLKAGVFWGAFTVKRRAFERGRRLMKILTLPELLKTLERWASSANSVILSE